MERVLLVIDVQNEYFSGLLPVTHPAGSLANVLKAMDAGWEHGVGVVVVQHAAARPGSQVFQRGSAAWELHPEVERRHRDLLLDKQLPGSFTGTGLERWLRERGVARLAIAGYMTHMCCDTTARQAFHRGFQVEFLSDATGTLNLDTYAGSVTAEELHRAVLVVQAGLFSQVLTTEQWVQGL